MAQQSLNNLRVNVAIQKVHRKTVPERVGADVDTQFNAVAICGIDSPAQPVTHRPVGNFPHRLCATFTGNWVVLKLLLRTGKQPAHLIDVGWVR